MPSMTGGDQLGPGYAPWANEGILAEALRFVGDGDGGVVEGLDFRARFRADSDGLINELAVEGLIVVLNLNQIGLTKAGRERYARDNAPRPPNEWKGTLPGESMIDKALQYILNAGSGATCDGFIEDHEPVGREMLTDLMDARYVVVVGGKRLELTDRGRLVLKIKPNAPPTLEELRQARAEAMEEREGVKRYIRRATENYERKLNENHAAQLAEIGRAIAEVEKAIAELELAAEERRVAEIAQADPRVGKMYRMFSPKYRFATPDPWRPTEIMGVAVVLTSAMERDCKKRGHHWPGVGDIVIRQLKKDGTPSAYYYDIRDEVTWRKEEPENASGN